MASTNMIQLKRIAEEASVSIGTVSRVLSNKAQVSEKTRDRVLYVAEKLNYRPNRLVRAIQTGKTKTIGVLINPAHEFHSHILAGIQDALSEQDHLPIVINARKLNDPAAPFPTNELELIHRLIEQRVDGIIICPIEDATPDEALNEAWKHRLPVVCVDRRMPNTHADFVGTDDYLGGRQAADFLLSLGHRRIVHLAGPSYASTGRLRRQGFEAVMQEHGIEYQVLEDPQFKHGLDQARQLLGSTSHPTAVFAASDLNAMAIYQAANELNLRIPQDLTVIGFADMSFAPIVTPALTTIRQFPRQIGQTAVDLIFKRMQGAFDDLEVQSVCIKPELVERASSKPFSAD